jgi:hypothetical protein
LAIRRDLSNTPQEDFIHKNHKKLYIQRKASFGEDKKKWLKFKQMPEIK